MNLELYLFRHGRTVWNAKGRYQGHADVALDQLGWGQALAVAERCTEIRPVRIYTSDLRRCADMAQEIARACETPVEIDERLRERDVGVWSGLTRSEIAERFPEDWAAWRQGDAEVCPGGGESLSGMTERVKEFMRAVRETNEAGPLVVVTHSGWVRTCMQWVLGDGVRRSGFGVPSQGSLTVVTLDDEGQPSLDAYNDRGHLLGVEPVDREGPAPIVY